MLNNFHLHNKNLHSYSLIHNKTVWKNYFGNIDHWPDVYTVHNFVIIQVQTVLAIRGIPERSHNPLWFVFFFTFKNETGEINFLKICLHHFFLLKGIAPHYPHVTPSLYLTCELLSISLNKLSHVQARLLIFFHSLKTDGCLMIHY